MMMLIEYHLEFLSKIEIITQVVLSFGSVNTQLKFILLIIFVFFVE